MIKVINAKIVKEKEACNDGSFSFTILLKNNIALLKTKQTSAL